MEPVRGGMLADVGPKAADVLGAARPGKSPASWAIRYAASFPEVMTVLSGMSTMAQLEDNLATMQPFKPMTAGDESALNSALAALNKITITKLKRYLLSRVINLRKVPLKSLAFSPGPIIGPPGPRPASGDPRRGRTGA